MSYVVRLRRRPPGVPGTPYGQKDIRLLEHSAELKVRLARNLLKQKKPAEAESVLHECQATFDRLNDGSPRRFLVLSLFGEALQEQHQHLAAEPLLTQGYAGMETHDLAHSNCKPWLTEAGERLVRFYEVTDQPEKARAWRAKLKAREPRTASGGVK